MPLAPIRIMRPLSAGRVHIRRWLLVLLTVVPWVIVAALLVVVGLQFRSAGRNSLLSSGSQTIPGKPGPWGQLDYRPIRIDPPDEFVFVPPIDQPPVHWVFHAMTKEQAVEFLKSAGITAAQLETIGKAAWKPEPQGVSVEPGDDFILSLSPDARGKIYSRLVEFEENSRQLDPVWFEKGQVEERIKDSGLSQSSLDLLKSLLYPQGPSLLLFADFEPALRRLPDDQERHRFMKAVSRKKTLLAGLRITPNSDLSQIIDYWGVGGRKKDVAPLLGAMRHEGDAKVNLVCLLPSFARERLFTYPFPGSVDGTGVKQDCFWTAMNFFSTTPDNRVNDMTYLRDLLKSDYYTINQPSQLGDVVFLATPQDAVIHAAAYVADDVVFTKNGESYTQPWILMRMDDMIDTYAVKHPSGGPLKVLCYRKKTL